MSIRYSSRLLNACEHRIYEETGMILKFAIGEVPAQYEAAIQEEEGAFGLFLRIPIERVSQLLTCVHPFDDCI
jgi:hypothetical protein